MDGINIWGMLGCAVTYAAAIFAAVDGIGDHMIRRHEAIGNDAINGLRLKTGSKLAAALIGVITAAVVLLLNSNWPAMIILTLVFLAIVTWVVIVYRNGSRTTAHRE